MMYCSYVALSYFCGLFVSGFIFGRIDVPMEIGVVHATEW